MKGKFDEVTKQDAYPEIAVFEDKAIKRHEVGGLLNIPELHKSIVLLLQAATACQSLCVQTDGTQQASCRNPFRYAEHFSSHSMLELQARLYSDSVQNQDGEGRLS